MVVFVAQEIWRNVVGYEGLYIVSNMGRIISLPRVRHKDSGDVFYSGKELNQTKCTNGYLKVCLFKDGVSRQVNVHRIVASAFLGVSDLTVNHINEDKTDNRVENLEYLSGRDNTRYTCCRKVESYDLDTGETIKQYAGIVDTASDGYSSDMVGNVCRGKCKEHGGVGWRYVSASN